MGLKLFADDNREVPEGWTTARTVEDAKLHLIYGDVDELSLDHDFDAPICSKCNFQCGHHGGANKNSCSRGCDCHSFGDENGLHLVEWMARTGRWPKNRPTIHSHNLDGGLRMNRLIAERFPRKMATSAADSPR